MYKRLFCFLIERVSRIFHVMIMQMHNSCRQIEQQVRILSGIEEELENVIPAVSSLKGMEDLAGQIRKKLVDVQEEKLILRQMLQVLSKILMNYVSCENRLINEFEQNTYYFHPRDIGIFQIQKVSDLIR